MEMKMRWKERKGEWEGGKENMVIMKEEGEEEGCYSTRDKNDVRKEIGGGEKGNGDGKGSK